MPYFLGDAFRLDSHAILPLVYDESLSYGEQVAHLQNHVNLIKNELQKIAEVTNNNSTWLSNLIQIVDQMKYEVANIDSTLDSFQTEIEQLVNNTLNEYNIKIQGQISDIETSFQSATSDIYNKITRMQNQISNAFIDLNNQYDTFKQLMQEFIAQQVVTKTGYTMLVTDPVTGRIINLNQSLNNLLQYMQSFAGITMQEYEQLQLTMDAYDNIKIPYMVYNSRAAFVFFPLRLSKYYENYFNDFQSIINQKIHEMETEIEKNTTGYNPYDGQKTNIVDISYQTAGKLLLEPTIQQYADFDLTMQEYEEMQLTIQEYATLIIPLEVMKKWNISDIITTEYIIDGYNLFTYQIEIDLTANQIVEFTLPEGLGYFKRIDSNSNEINIAINYTENTASIVSTQNTTSWILIEIIRHRMEVRSNVSNT